MSGLEWDTIALLTGTAFLAGFIDSIAGGGGLLTVPALLIAGIDPVTDRKSTRLNSSHT